MDIVEQLLKVARFGSAWVLYLLILLSVFSLGVMLERALFFRRNARGKEGLRDLLVAAIRASDARTVESLLQKSASVEGRAVANAFAFREGGAESVSHALESELAAARPELEKGLAFLGTLGNNGPFIGLLGTVIGVIEAFRALGTDAARSGAMDAVMSGIAESLVATGVGLIVALPAVVAYNALQKRIGDIETEVNSLGRLITAWLELRERGGALHARVDDDSSSDGPPAVRTLAGEGGA